MRLAHSFLSVPVAFGAAALTSAGVQAQERTQAQARAGLEEVIVTAQRRETRLQETDISLTVMDAVALDERGIADFTQIGDFAPNVRTLDIPTSAGGSISIRGFRNGETIATFEPKVGLYIDGVLIAKNSGSAFDILDLERVEILRGPQGTLYGRNTAGGAVNFITKKPADEWSGRIGATVGNYNQRDFKGTLNVPLVGPEGVFGNPGTSRLNLKATVGILNRDGYQDNLFPAGGNREVWDKDREIAQVQLQWKPNDNVSLLYAFDHSDIDEINPAPAMTDFNPVTRPQLAPFVTDGGGDRNIDYTQFRKVKVQGHSLTLDWRLNDDLSLVSISALRTSEDESAQDADGTPVFVINTDAGNELETFTQEVRLVGQALSERLNYVMGAFYMDEDIKRADTTNVLPNFGLLLSGLEASGKNEVWAVFGEGTYALTERLDVTLGLRYTAEDRQMSRADTTIIPASNTRNIIQLPDAQRDFSDVSGTLSLAYDWTDDIMTYFKVSKGYVSGGFNPRAPSPTTFQRGYDEETVYTYEIGWKTTWLDGRLLVNGAVFYNDYKDLQVNLLDPETLRNNLVNAADAEISGLEIEVQAKPTDNLYLGAGYGYLDTKFKKYVDPVTGADLSKVTAWAHAPEHSFNAFGRYVVPHFLSVGDLVLRIDYAWVDDYFLLSSAGNFVDGYDLLNARIALEGISGPGDSRFSVALWGRNLTDEVYYTTGYNLVSSIGIAGRFTGPPRTYGLDLNFQF